MMLRISPSIPLFPLRRFFTSEISPPPSSTQWRVLFFGGDSFSVQHLRPLYHELETHQGRGMISQLEIVSPPDKKTGRGLSEVRVAPLKQAGKELGLKVHEAPMKHSLKDWQIPQPSAADPTVKWDVGVVVSFGYFLTPSVLDSFSQAAVNVHPSLLPKYRGASPIQYAILNGEGETGISIIELHRTRWDAGRILKQTRVPVPPEANFHSLAGILAQQGAQDLMETLRNLKTLSANAVVQPETGGPKAPKVTAEKGQVEWAKMTGTDVKRLNAAIGHQVALYTGFLGMKITLRELQFTLKDEAETKRILSKFGGPSSVCGDFYYDKQSKALWVLCQGGTLAGCTQLQVDGKKQMTAESFINGYQKKHAGETGATRFQTIQLFD